MTTATLGSLDLTDKTKYAVLFETLDLGEPDRREHRRVIQMELRFSGSNAANLRANIKAVRDELTKAARSGGNVRDDSAVTFTVSIAGADVSFPLVPFSSGPYQGECGRLNLGPKAIQRSQQVTTFRHAYLTLSTAAYGSGSATSISTSGVLTNGASSVFQADIGGDEPAPGKLTITDVSESVVIQRVRVGQRIASSMADADFTPWLAATAASGASTETDATRIGGTYARRAASDTWATIGYISPSTPTKNKLKAHVLPVFRDHAVDLRVPTGLTVGPASPLRLQEADDWLYNESQTDLYMNFDEEVTDGSALVAVIFGKTKGATLTPPTGWSEAITVNAGAATMQAWIAYKLDADAGDTGGVWQASSTGSYFYVWMAEFAGILTASALDDTGSSTSGGNTTDTGAQANELAVMGTADADNTCRSPATPWTVVKSFNGEASVSPFAKVGLRYLTSASLWSTKLGSGTSNLTIAASFKAKSTAIGRLPTGVTYEVRVAALDGSGNVGPACATAAYAYPANSQAVNGENGASLYVEWTAPAEGTTPTEYRIFFRVAGGTWHYIDTNSTDTTFALTSFGDATAGDPPNYTSTRSEFRLRVGLASGETLYETPIISPAAASGAWEMTRQPAYTGDLPPLPTSTAGNTESWIVELQGRNLAGQTPNIDFDGACLMSATAPTLLMESYDSDGDLGGLTVPRVWEYDLRPDGIDGARWRAVPVALTEADVTINSSAAVFNGTTSTLTAPLTAGFTLDETQSWIAFRVRPTGTLTASGSHPLFVWGDSSGDVLYCYMGSGGLDVGRVQGGSFTQYEDGAGGALSVDTDYTVIIAWDATNVYWSVDGSNLTNIGGTADIPTLSSTTLRLGHDNDIFGSGALFFEGSFYWVATGTGTLSNADAAYIHGFGNTDPGYYQFPDPPTFLWHATSNSEAWDGGDEVGQPEWEGRPRWGPGDTELVIACDITGGVCNTSDAKVTVDLTYTPQHCDVAT